MVLPAEPQRWSLRVAWWDVTSFRGSSSGCGTPERGAQLGVRGNRGTAIRLELLHVV